MRARHFILLLIVLTGTALMAFTPDSYIDDVYYWESDEPLSLPTVNRQSTDGEPNRNPEGNAVQIYYLEDSITQNSDTVIKAVIRR